MPMAQALRLCPDAIRASPHFETYSDYSQRVMAIIREYGGVMEQVSVDEPGVLARVRGEHAE